MTNASGTATSTVFTANSSVGPDAVTATVGGVSTPSPSPLQRLRPRRVAPSPTEPMQKQIQLM
jgi:hypothetical protein